jgi:hypothetical protein
MKLSWDGRHEINIGKQQKMRSNCGTWYGNEVAQRLGPLIYLRESAK